MNHDDESGFSLIELMIGALLFSIVIGMVGAFMINVFNGGSFAQGTSETINHVRNAMQQIEKEVRGADTIAWCAPSGSCIQVGAQTPNGAFRTVKYTHSTSQLYRSEYDTGSGTWSTPRSIITRVANTGAQPVFACDTQSTLLRVIIDLRVEPTPSSNPNFHVQTSVRPRNFPAVATCP